MEASVTEVNMIFLGFRGRKADLGIRDLDSGPLSVSDWPWDLMQVTSVEWRALHGLPDCEMGKCLLQGLASSARVMGFF